jgi:hypothetical protein
MTAFTKPDGGFIVVYSHDGEQPDERRARGAGEAAAVAIRMLAARLKIYPGEVIQGRRADEPQADDTQADLPEVSRASRLAARPAVRSEAQRRVGALVNSTTMIPVPIYVGRASGGAGDVRLGRRLQNETHGTHPAAPRVDCGQI